jgi:sugar lactone lactonase YvrE
MQRKTANKNNHSDDLNIPRASHPRVSSRKGNSSKFSIMFPLSILVVVSLLSPFAYLLLSRLGLGSNFPAQDMFRSMEPLLQDSALEIVALLPMPPGNIAVSKKNRVFFNFHPEYGPSTCKVAELTSKETYKAFPNSEFQSKLISVLSMRIDSQDRLWLLDFANHGIGGNPKLFAFALKNKDALVIDYEFPSTVAGFGSMLNDFQVDPSGAYVYIVDTSIVAMTPSLIVYSIEMGHSYRILSGHSSMFGRSTFLSVSDTQLKFGPMGLTIHADSLALDPSGSKLYYGALTNDKLYSISTSHLLHYVKVTNESYAGQLKAEERLPGLVHTVLENKPVTDGLTVDAAGNIWMTALEHSAIAVAVPEKTHKDTSVGSFALQEQKFNILKVVQNSSLIRWPDGFSFGSDGLYFTNSALHLKFSGKRFEDHAPFHILKLSTSSLKASLKGVKDASFSLPTAGH